MDDEEAAAMREELGAPESGLERVIRGAFELLQLISFFTAGEDKEARAHAHPARHQRLGGRRRDPLGHPARLCARRGGVVEGPGGAGGYAGARDKGCCASRAATT